MACSLALVGGTVWAQTDNSARLLSPSGYTGAINTPTADVQAWGTANLGWSNNNPEFARSFPQGRFGSLNAGVGLLPGLEAVGRLSFDGDLNCNQYVAPCPSRTRDLSVSAKYQLPWRLWNDTRVAAGVADFGGAATNYRQVYGVATTTWQGAEFSLGYSRAKSPLSLMHGTFGSVRYALNPQWTLLAEHDTRENRAGLQYRLPVGDRSQLVAGLSRKWTQHTGQEAQQLQLAWVFHMDRSTPRPAEPPAQTGPRPAAVVSTSAVALTPALVQKTSGVQVLADVEEQRKQAVVQPALGTTVQTSPTVAQPAVGMPAPLREPATANDMAQELKEAGFANIEVKYRPAGTQSHGVWHITAEPRAYRQSHIEALGQAMRPWLQAVRQQRIAGQDRFQVTLTYQREPVLYAAGQAACLSQWAQGEACDAAALPLTISRQAMGAGPSMGAAEPLTATPTPTPEPTFESVATASAGASWAPQLTLSPALRNTLGTEYGLADYSLAAQIGAEVGLVPGLFWQGIYLVPVSESDDYQAGRVFGDSRYSRREWYSQQLTYWKALPWGIQAQVSGGQLSPTQTGTQLDALWMSDAGRWRLGVTSARYRNEGSTRPQLPKYAQLRYSVLPGAWHAQATVGQFMNGDRGYKLASVHWAGDTRFELQYQKTGTPTRNTLPKRAFLGFTVSFPFGPKAAVPIGPAWLRAQDRWSWGLQTKVGEKDNYLTSGYGEFPRQRHGLWSDVSDHDRNGSADIQAQLPRLRAVLSAPLATPAKPSTAAQLP
jgi:hypothetical protein